MIVIVHSVSWVVAVSQLQLHSSRSNGQQPIETSHLEAQGLLNADSQPAGTGVRYIAFAPDGYQLVTERKNYFEARTVRICSRNWLTVEGLPTHQFLNHLSDISEVLGASVAEVRDMRDVI
jgi:hypothetical protein